MEIVVTLIMIQTILLPIQGALYLGAKAERLRKEELFHRALYVVRQYRKPYI